MRLLHAAALAAAFVVLMFGAQGLIDKIDQDATARADYKRWVNESCLPVMHGESAVIVSDGKQMRCRVYSRNHRGQVPIVVSSAVMEVPR